MTTDQVTLPRVVARDEWRRAREAMLQKEKEFTRARDALAAERRRLPMVEVEKDYVFEGPDGEATLADLFEERRQLVLYHFMFGPNQEEGCRGCSMVVDNMGHPAHLHARDITRVLVSRAPLAKIEPFRERMRWTVPWYSSHESDFNPDFGVGPESPRPDAHQDGETFGLSVFLRDGDRVFRTYFTDRRGVEYLGSSFSYFDITPYGRQEEWEDSPEGCGHRAPRTSGGATTIDTGAENRPGPRRQATHPCDNLERRGSDDDDRRDAADPDGRRAATGARVAPPDGRRVGLRGRGRDGSRPAPASR